MTPGFVTCTYSLLGLGVTALGVPLALNRVAPNSAYGFRTAKTLSNNEMWYAANHIQGVDLCIAGPCILIATLAVHFSMPAGPPERMLMIDSSILVGAVTLAAIHGAWALGRM